MSEEITVKKICEEIIPSKFNADAAKGERAIIQVCISGEGGGDWYLTVADGTCKATAGVHENPDSTIKMSAPDYIAMNTGKMNAIMAVTFGKLKFSGNQDVLFKMQKWFPI